MSVLYLLTSPKPKLAGTDAVFQEIAALQEATGGRAVELCPSRHIGSRYPRQFFGLHCALKIRQLEKTNDVHHIHYPALYHFPVLSLLNNPIVYTVTAALDANKKPTNLPKLRKLSRVIVSNERDAGILKKWGLSNVSTILPGVDTSSVTKCRREAGQGRFRLLMASAPWVEKQFDLKGIDDLLKTVAASKEIELTLLWRGVLSESIHSRVNALGISDRVEVLDQHVNVSDHLAKSPRDRIVGQARGYHQNLPPFTG